MFLLDTHAFYWFLTDDNRLSKTAKNIIETNNEICVSVASFWEMAIKESIGKLKLPAPVDKLMDDALELNFLILSIRGSHLAELNKLPSIHRDPFDRLLICQSKAENLTFITCDSNIEKYDITTIW